MNSVEVNTNALDYCINKAIPDGSNLYYALLFEQNKNKSVLIGLHAFLNELTGIISECSDPGIARIKLHWWHEEIDRLYQQVARHPVTRQIAHSLTINKELKTSFDSIIEAFDSFIFIDQFATLDDALALCRVTTGELWQECDKQILGSSSENVAVRQMGEIYQYICCLQEPHIYISDSRCIIPISIINQANIFDLRQDILKNPEKQTATFKPLLDELISRLEQIYSELRKSKTKASNHALIMNQLVLKTCHEIQNDGCRLLDTHIRLTPLRKLWIAWWTNINN